MIDEQKYLQLTLTRAGLKSGNLFTFLKIIEK